MTKASLLNDCLQLKRVTRTFDDLSSSRFLEKFSLCKHSILSLSFANGDFDHGRGPWESRFDSDKILRYLIVAPFPPLPSQQSLKSSTRGR